MKVSRKSWHYRFLKWNDMEPVEYNLTSRYYKYSVGLCIFYFIFSGWFIEGIRHLASMSKSEPVEFIDGDDDDEDEYVSI